MRTIIRDNYTPELGQYHERIIIDPVKEKTWLFDCDGVFLDITKVFVANEYGDNKEYAISQDFFTKEVQQMAEDLSEEEAARIAADEDLQDQIDVIKAASDVVDIVGTYAELLAYDTSKLTDSDIIKVLADENHDGATTYYRWMAATSSWSYIGEQGPYYTQTEVDNLLDEKQDTLIAGHGIDIASDGKTISAGTLFYCDTTLVGSLYDDPDWDWFLNLYRDSAMTIPVTNEDMLEAIAEGPVFINIGLNNYAAVTAVVDEPEEGTTYAMLTFEDVSDYGYPYILYMGYFYGVGDTEWNVMDFYQTDQRIPLYDTLGESTNGPITRKASREMLWNDTARNNLKIGTLASGDTLGNYSMSIGNNAAADGVTGIAIGYNTKAHGNGAIAIGPRTVVNQYGNGSSDSVAIGADITIPTGVYSSVALGERSQVTRSYEVGVGRIANNGSVVTPRVISGVANGTLQNDAVNLSQLTTAVSASNTFITGETVPGLKVYTASVANEVYANAYYDDGLVTQKGATHGPRGDIYIPGNSTPAEANGIFIGSGQYPKATDNVPHWQTDGIIAIGSDTDARGKYRQLIPGGSTVERVWYPFRTVIGNRAGRDSVGTSSYGGATFIGAYAHSELPESASMSADWSVALGFNSVATRADEVSFGSGSVDPGKVYTTRYLANVRAGTLDTDAVNVGQLNTAIASITPNNISSADWSALWQ